MSNLSLKNNVFCFKNSLVVTLFLSMSVLVTSVKAEDLTVYASFGEPIHVHNNQADYGMGHRRLRDGDLRLTENGDVIGNYHSISTVINVNKETKKDTRENLILVKLPEGTFWLEDVVEMDHKSLPQAGYKLNGVILGGTQGYKGITGTYDAHLSADGKVNVVTYHIVRGK
jgi:hypothetical protein